jgi:carboxyl-terminal processing protease
VIDLRGNPGGIGGMANGLSGYLFDKEASLGKMQMRSGYQNFHVTPQKNAPTPIFTGPLVILQDYGSASTSEVFAAGLQDLGRAFVIGERSAGAALPSFIEKLPTGGLFQYAVGDFKTSKGTLIEGRGVLPNLVAPPTRAALLAGRDLALEAALARITKLQKRSPAVTK